jgi:hypothetical protein
MKCLLLDKETVGCCVLHNCSEPYLRYNTVQRTMVSMVYSMNEILAKEGAWLPVYNKFVAFVSAALLFLQCIWWRQLTSRCLPCPTSRCAMQCIYALRVQHH